MAIKYDIIIFYLNIILAAPKEFSQCLMVSRYKDILAELLMRTFPAQLTSTIRLSGHRPTYHIS